MARISVGAALGEGFGLIARRPLAVAAWGLIPTALQLLTLAMIAPMYITMFSALSHGGAPSEATALPQYAGIQLLAQLMNLIQLFVSAVVYCAVFRAVVHPEQSSFAYMRVGLAEVFLAVLIFGAVIALFLAMLIVMIPVGILVAIVAGVSHGGAAIFAIMIPVVILAMLVAIAVLGLRFSLVGPMLVDDNRFHLFESWTLTRGRMGSLLLLALGLFGIFLALEVVLLIVLAALGAAAVGAAGGLAQLGSLAQQSPQALISHIWPFLAVWGVLMIPIAGCGLTIVGAPFARIYVDLKSDAAEAFI